MASILVDEPQRQRRVLSESSRTGVGDEHVGRGRESLKKQSHSSVSIDANETQQRVLKRVECLGTEVKRRRHSVRRNRAADEHVAEGRNAGSPKGGGSEAIGSKNLRQLRSSTRNNEASESPRTPPILKPKYKASTPEKSRVSFKRNGVTSVKPESCPVVGSLSHELSPRSNKSSASTTISRNSTRTNHNSKPPDLSPKSNPNAKTPRAESRNHSREDRSVAWATPTDASIIGSTIRGLFNRRVVSPETSSPNAHNKQVSKSPSKQSELNCTVSLERHVCPRCVAKNDGSNAFRSNASLRSKGTTEVQGKNNLEPKLRMSRRACQGITPKQEGSNATESNVPLDSKRIITYKTTYMPPAIQSSSRGIRQEGVTRKSPSVRSSSNALSSPSRESLSSRKNSCNYQGADRRSVRRHGETVNTSSPRGLAAFLRGNETHERSASLTDSLSTLSLHSTSTVDTKNSIIASDRLNPIYSGDRYYGPHYDDGDESSQDSLDLSTEMDNVMDSIRSTAREILSSDVEDVWLSRAVLDGIAESKKASVDTLIEGVSNKLDDLEVSFFGPSGTDESMKKPVKSWFPKVNVKVIW